MPLRFTAHVMKGQPAAIRSSPLHPPQRLDPTVWWRGQRRHDRPQIPISGWIIAGIPRHGSRPGPVRGDVWPHTFTFLVLERPGLRFAARSLIASSTALSESIAMRNHLPSVNTGAES